MNFLKRNIKWLTEIFFPPKKLLQENKDYIFTEIILNEELVSAVKLLNGQFDGVVYYYGFVKLIPSDDSSENKLSFQYTIWDSAGHTKANLAKHPEFVTHIGDVLVAIIADEQSKGEYVTARIHDPEKPHLL